MEAVYFSETLVSAYEFTLKTHNNNAVILTAVRTTNLFSPVDGGSMFLRNVGIYLQVYAASNPRRTTSSNQ
jgi:hypothetical protein